MRSAGNKALSCLVCMGTAVALGCSSVRSDMKSFLTQHELEECDTYVHNFVLEAPRLYGAGERDSLREVLGFIKDECGSLGPVPACEQLLAIEGERFEEGLLGAGQIEEMLRIREQQESGFRWHQDTNAAFELRYPRYIEFRETLAANAVAHTTPNTPQYALAQFYSHNFDHAFSQIQGPEVRNTKLGQQYDQLIRKVQDTYQGYGDFNFSGGAWIPTGPNEALGNHPELGLYLGGEMQHWRGGLLFSLRFGKTQDPYTVGAQQGLVTTRNFISFLLGPDFGVKVLESGRASTDLYAGLGVDAMYSVEEPEEPPSRKGHAALNAGVGLRQRLFLSRGGQYIGLQLRYSVTNYPNSGGTDITGNVVSLNLLYGVSTNVTLHDVYRAANYQGLWRPQR